MPHDLVLSSGFLAFARHAGFLKAVEEVGLEIEGLCGTSSGALVGAMWAAGMDADTVLEELTRRPPLAWVTWHLQPWRGLFRMDAVIEELQDRVPATFAELGRPFAVGTSTLSREHRLLTEGPLPLAVAASCAVQWLFTPVVVDGTPLGDGGATDRVGAAAYRALRPGADLVAHLVDRSAGADGEAGLDGVPIVRSPRSGASLWSLGDVRAAAEQSRVLAHQVLAGL